MALRELCGHRATQASLPSCWHTYCSRPSAYACYDAAVEDVESCVGRRKRLGPPSIPRRCHLSAARLDECLAQRAAQGEASLGDT